MDSPANIEERAGCGITEKVVRKWIRFFPLGLFVSGAAAIFIAKSFGLDSSTAELILLILATLSTLLLANQRLPAQNVFGIAITISIFSGVILLAEKFFQVSIAHPLPNDRFDTLSDWTTPLLWMVVLVNARGIAKFLMQRFRGNRNFGLWVIAFASLLAALWGNHSQWDWQKMTIQFALAAVALVVTTPCFIEKKPVEQPVDFQPLLLAFLILLW